MSDGNWKRLGASQPGSAKPQAPEEKEATAPSPRREPPQAAQWVQQEHACRRFPEPAYVPFLPGGDRAPRATEQFKLVAKGFTLCEGVSSSAKGQSTCREWAQVQIQQQRAAQRGPRTQDGGGRWERYSRQLRQRRGTEDALG